MESDNKILVILISVETVITGIACFWGLLTYLDSRNFLLEKERWMKNYYDILNKKTLLENFIRTHKNKKDEDNISVADKELYNNVGL